MSDDFLMIQAGILGLAEEKAKELAKEWDVVTRTHENGSELWSLFDGTRSPQSDTQDMIKWCRQALDEARIDDYYITTYWAMFSGEDCDSAEMYLDSKEDEQEDEDVVG